MCPDKYWTWNRGVENFMKCNQFTHILVCISLKSKESPNVEFNVLVSVVVWKTVEKSENWELDIRYCSQFSCCDENNWCLVTNFKSAITTPFHKHQNTMEHSFIDLLQGNWSYAYKIRVETLKKSELSGNINKT